MVGCGVVVTAYDLPCFMKMDAVDLAAVYDRFEGHTRASARLFGAKEQYLDDDEMIEHAESGACTSPR